MLPSRLPCLSPLQKIRFSDAIFLSVTQNDISGTIPDELYGLVQMERLYLSFNSFNGTISTKIGQLAALTEFYAYTNELSGELPTELGDLTFLENFVVGKNKLEGENESPYVRVSFRRLTFATLPRQTPVPDQRSR